MAYVVRPAIVSILFRADVARFEFNIQTPEVELSCGHPYYAMGFTSPPKAQAYRVNGHIRYKDVSDLLDSLATITVSRFSGMLDPVIKITFRHGEHPTAILIGDLNTSDNGNILDHFANVPMVMGRDMMVPL